MCETVAAMPSKTAWVTVPRIATIEAANMVLEWPSSSPWSAPGRMALGAVPEQHRKYGTSRCRRRSRPQHQKRSSRPQPYLSWSLSKPFCETVCQQLHTGGWISIRPDEIKPNSRVSLLPEGPTTPVARRPLLTLATSRSWRSSELSSPWRRLFISQSAAAFQCPGERSQTRLDQIPFPQRKPQLSCLSATRSGGDDIHRD
ncbi:hypothetical protein RHI9324_04794 [Rhizobium sp. CECT 9324]|nr:hypothetical protein RHI9324_04794 [Rhizobium sp. CECT 9324]